VTCSAGASGPAGGRDKPPVVLLSGIRWDFLWQRHQILATLFARAGYPTVFVETTGLADPRLLDPATLRKVLARVSGAFRSGKGRSGDEEPVPGLEVYGPLVLPPTRAPFRLLNRRLFVPRVARDLARLTGGERPVVIAYPPTSTTLDLVDALRPRLLLYDCVLNYEHFPGTPRDIAQTERELLQRADLVTVDSGFLAEKHRRVRPDMLQVPPGVDWEPFARARTGVLRREAKTLCFFGTMDERRFDYDLVAALAGAGYRMLLLGPLSRLAFATVPGVEYRGEVPHRELPRHLAEADALVIPYRITAFSKGTFPAKIFECLATGKPTVATPLPDLLPFRDALYLADGAEGFLEILRNLPKTESEEKVEARVSLARDNSWEARFARLERALLERLLERL